MVARSMPEQHSLHSLWPVIEARHPTSRADIHHFLLSVAATIYPDSDLTGPSPSPRDAAHMLALLSNLITDASDAKIAFDQKPLSYAPPLPPTPPSPPTESHRSPSPMPLSVSSSAALTPTVSHAQSVRNSSPPASTDSWSLTDHYTYNAATSSWHCLHPRCVSRNSQIAHDSTARRFGVYQAPRFATSSINKRAREHWDKHRRNGEMEDQTSPASPTTTSATSYEMERTDSGSETRWWRHGKEVPRSRSPVLPHHILTPSVSSPAAYRHALPPPPIERNVRGVLRENQLRHQAEQAYEEAERRRSAEIRRDMLLDGSGSRMAIQTDVVRPMRTPQEITPVATSVEKQYQISDVRGSPMDS